MKAAFFKEHGGPEVLQYGDVPDPQAAADEIIVDVHAASVNAADWKVRLGTNGPKSHFPYVLGRDFSGVVRSLGADVEDFQVGDSVFGVCEVSREGAYAEQLAIKAAIVASKPQTLSHINTAAVAVTGLTALITLEDTLKLQAGETILIHGGAGGVANLAIQLAKHIGAHVITTASPSNHEYLSTLGADTIIDYNTDDFTQVVSDCDAVFDTVGGDVTERSFQVLKSGGRAAFIATGPTAPTPPRADIQSLRPNVTRDRPHLERLMELVVTGVLQVPPITVYPLSEAAAAHAVSESRHLRGKLVLAVR